MVSLIPYNTLANVCIFLDGIKIHTIVFIRYHKLLCQYLIHMRSTRNLITLSYDFFPYQTLRNVHIALYVLAYLVLRYLLDHGNFFTLKMIGTKKEAQKSMKIRFLKTIIKWSEVWTMRNGLWDRRNEKISSYALKCKWVKIVS